MYHLTTDYITKCRIHQLQTKNINLCEECYISNSKIIYDKTQCDMCHKIQSCTPINRDYFISSVQKCIICRIYTISYNIYICHNCKFDPKRDLQNENIGKYYVVFVNDYSAHPKMNYEKHLVDVYPDKYKDYPLYFQGQLKTYWSCSYRQSIGIIFEDVTFPLNDIRKRNKSWLIYKHNII
jgi:hypothetical protein